MTLPGIRRHVGVVSVPLKEPLPATPHGFFGRRFVAQSKLREKSL